MRSWSSLLLPLIRLRLLANRRLHTGLPPMEMDAWWSWSVSCMIFSENKSNNVGESKYLCRTPTVVLKNSPGWLFKRSALLEFSYSERLELVLHLCQSFWGPATGLHAGLRQMPSWSLWSCETDHAGIVGASLWLLKICFTVLKPGLKPSCSSASSSYALAVIESAEDNLEHDCPGMAHYADSMIVLTLFEVSFLWYRYDE